MTAVDKLKKIQEKNKSIICLGLDLDPRRMPPDHTKSIKSMYEFVMRIVDATSDLVCAYKPNMAFFEALGPEGLSLLRSITSRMSEDMVVIVDGKRGDIGNTASFYAESMYQTYRADWVTLNPYMGYDSMRPFLEHKDKGIFVLCLTSNTGSKDFQHLTVDGKPLYHVVAEKVDYWNKDNNCGLVVGATQPEELRELRSIAGYMPLLIPGVGAQGGSLEKAAMYGTDSFKKLAVINVTRSVLYASREADFAQAARQELKKLNDTISRLRSGELTIDDTPVEGNPGTEQDAQSDGPADPPPAPDQSSSGPPPEFRLPPIPDLPFMKPTHEEKKEEPLQNRSEEQAANHAEDVTTPDQPSVPPSQYDPTPDQVPSQPQSLPSQIDSMGPQAAPPSAPEQVQQERVQETPPSSSDQNQPDRHGESPPQRQGNPPDDKRSSFRSDRRNRFYRGRKRSGRNRNNRNDRRGKR